jgi:hypothetical protein
MRSTEAMTNKISLYERYIGMDNERVNPQSINI